MNAKDKNTEVSQTIVESLEKIFLRCIHTWNFLDVNYNMNCLINNGGMSSNYVSQLFCRDILFQLLRSLVESLYIILPTSCSHLHYLRVS